MLSTTEMVSPPSDRKKTSPRVRRTTSQAFLRWRVFVIPTVVAIFSTLALYEGLSHYNETRFVRQVAENVVGRTGATDEVSQITVLRDYLRQHVSSKNYLAEGRPFLRDTAAETLRSGQGHCGEATRVFVNLADSLGIRAQRLYLEGQQRHVVALVTLADGKRIIADSSDQTYIRQLETIDQLGQHPEFNYYSSFNPSRMPFSLSPNATRLGPISYYMENPHALKALFWLALALLVVFLKLILQRGRGFARRIASLPAHTGAQSESA